MSWATVGYYGLKYLSSVLFCTIYKGAFSSQTASLEGAIPDYVLTPQIQEVAIGWQYRGPPLVDLVTEHGSHSRPLVGGLFLNAGSGDFVEDTGEDRVGVDHWRPRWRWNFFVAGVKDADNRSLFDIVDVRAVKQARVNGEHAVVPMDEQYRRC